MQSSMCILIRQGTNQPWGFRLQGGRDYGQPLTVQKISPGSIAEHRNLRMGDAILQIGRERTVDMTHEDAQDAILRSGNRLDLLVLRPLVYKNHINKPSEQAQIRAVVHKQYNSPLGLYSTENIADSLISQAQVLTNGTAVGLDYKTMNAQTVKRSEVYRMVHEEEEDESSSSASPSPTYMRRQAPAAPPKPAAQQQYRPAQPPQQPPPQRQQPPPPPQQPHQPPPQKQQQYHQPPPQQRLAQQPPQQQQPQQQQPQNYQQYNKDHLAASRWVNNEPQNYIKPVQSQPRSTQPSSTQPSSTQRSSTQPSSTQRSSTQPSSTQPSSTHPSAAKSGPTFQSIIPVQSSTQPYANEVNWSPTQGHQLPVWPPQKSDAPIPTSSQSVKWSGSSGEPKKFIWPPPKDYVEVREEMDGNQRRTIYTHVKDTRPNPARVYVSPRSPARLAAAAREPYSNEYREIIPPKSGRFAHPIRRFDDLFSSNSTRLPPTYRAPPGTSHVAA